MAGKPSRRRPAPFPITTSGTALASEPRAYDTAAAVADRSLRCRQSGCAATGAVASQDPSWVECDPRDSRELAVLGPAIGRRDDHLAHSKKSTSPTSAWRLSWSPCRNSLLASQSRRIEQHLARPAVDVTNAHE